MQADLDATLNHDGRQWVVRAESLSAAGPTLPELDRAFSQALRECGRFPPGTRVSVFMGFDNETLPDWIRQYASHYFNRYVELEV